MLGSSRAAKALVRGSTRLQRRLQLPTTTTTSLRSCRLATVVEANTANNNTNSWRSVQNGLLAVGIVSAPVGFYFWNRDNNRNDEGITAKKRKLRVGERQRPASSSSSSPTNFQILSALELKDEMQAVRMAQILHDLHELAREQQQQQASPPTLEQEAQKTNKTLFERLFWRRPFMLFTRTSSSSSSAPAPSSDVVSNMPDSTTTSSSSSNTGREEENDASSSQYLSLQGVDLMQLQPEKAHALIEALHNGILLDQTSLVSLLEASKTVLKQDATVIDLRNNNNNTLSSSSLDGGVAVVGDLHGSLACLGNVLRLLGLDNNDKSAAAANKEVVVFNGDFVDRGSESLEVLCTLLLLKLAYPRRVFLIRGNHEDSMVSSAYGFQEEIGTKYDSDKEKVENSSSINNTNDSSSTNDIIWASLSNVFSALPFGARTETAVILHGGIPSSDFSLDDLEAVTTEQRCQLPTLIEAKDSVEEMLQNIIWSDPSPENGIRPNSKRGCGVFFGPDVARDFLKRHDAMYLIRGHEVAEQGVDILDCGEGRGVITVFSNAAYPDGKGHNLGAVIHLDKDGGCHSVEFNREVVQDNDEADGDDPYDEALRSLIAANRRKLEREFRYIARGNERITPSQWAKVMSRALELPDIPWMALQPSLAPVREEEDGAGLIDWQQFLEADSSSLATSADLNGVAMEILYANHKMLLTVFRFLDVDGNGTVDIDEFKAGVDLLNKRLPGDKQIKDAEKLFNALDLDGNGVIDLQEFSEVFKVM